MSNKILSAEEALEANFGLDMRRTIKDYIAEGLSAKAMLRQIETLSPHINMLVVIGEFSKYVERMDE